MNMRIVLNALGVKITDEQITQFEAAIPGLIATANAAPQMAQSLLERFAAMEARNKQMATQIAETYSIVQHIRAHVGGMSPAFEKEYQTMLGDDVMKAALEADEAARAERNNDQDLFAEVNQDDGYSGNQDHGGDAGNGSAESFKFG